MNNYQEYIHISKYARWIEEQKRRETWDETVTRYINYFKERFPDIKDISLNSDGSIASPGDVGDNLYTVLYDAITIQNVMPSMRALMTAGKALERDNVSGYNCAALAIDHPRAFDEMMYILLCGTGVGFSVERQFINKLPEIAEEFYETESVVTVADSKLGWAKAFKELLSLLWVGQVPRWDVSKVRPKGARLKTFGGTASGPEPLERLFRFAVSTFKGAKGRKLTSLECHDLCCMVGDVVVVGGVRRSACISLSNLTDDRMRRAKFGEWYTSAPYRRLANNSTAYTEPPDFESYLKEMVGLYRGKSGERGIINRVAFKKKAEQIGRDPEHEFLVNPCGEIILRPNQFCNLTEVVVRPSDTLESLVKKVRLAVILGTMQATLTNFRYLRPIWQQNTEEERLLGVSLTGIQDHKIMRDPYNGKLVEWLGHLRNIAWETNNEWAKLLGITPATAITCVKPSGTVSQLVDSSSGIHPRYSRFYIRRVTENKGTPMAEFLKAQGIPYKETDTAYLFEFPIASPKGSKTNEDVDAEYQLDLWSIYQGHWCDHNPSQTIYYTDDDFTYIMDWCWRNFNRIGGLSFFPKADHIYEAAPYEPITEEQYKELSSKLVEIKWDGLAQYETTDTTTGTQEYACVGEKGCEL